MQVTILSPQIGISEESYLGGGVTDREFLYRLADRGYNIEILLPEGESYRRHKNVNVHLVPKNLLLKKSYTINFYFLCPIIKFLRHKKVDILRIHSPYSIGIGVSLLKFFRKCPPVWFSFHHLENKLDWAILDRVLPRFADGITVLSDDTLKDLKSRFKWLDRKITKITPLGIDKNIFRRIEEPDLAFYCDGNISLDRPIVLFVGLLIKRKGIDILIKSWQIIKSLCPDAQLVIIGQGPLKYKINKLKRMDSSVFHIRYVNQKNLANFYSAANVFLFPTLKEGFGMVVGEAMSCGTPAVVSDAKGARDLVIDGKTGFKVPIGDYRDLADKVLFLLRNKDLSLQMGKEAAVRIHNKFSWDRGVGAIEEFLDMLIFSKKRL